MKKKEITEIPIKALKKIELYDIVIIHHGFESYNRDYYFIIESGTKKNQGRFKILFTHCFDLQYSHNYVDKEFPQFLRDSWGDHLITENVPKNEKGYWWGQGFTLSYPGFSYDPESVRAKEISEIADKKMYSVKLETEHYQIDFVFHDFKYEFLNNNTEISDQVTIPLKDFKYKK